VGYTVALECGGTLAEVGGKGRGLSQLIGHGLPVPPGFVVTTRAYRESVAMARLADQLVTSTATLDSTTDNRGASAALSDLFTNAGMPAHIADSVRSAYRALGTDTPVAVRSSATAEDADDASFAGQQETFLWIVGEDAVVERVVACWASLFSPQAIGYRARLGIAPDDVDMAVVVQTMVDARAAGVMMTLDPVTGDDRTIYIESSVGLGESVVRGEVDPDRYSVRTEDLTLRESRIGAKGFAYRHNGSGTVERIALPQEAASVPTLTADDAVELAGLGRDIASAFGRPMDIEWAIDDQERIWLVQARPETVWSRAGSADRSPDPVHSPTDESTHWARSNLGEAMPGVQTPLSWTTWADAVERAAREAAFRIGAFEEAERHVPPDVNDRFIRVFHGRPAIQVEFAAAVGDRVPGTTGEASVISILGRAPATVQYAPTRRRYLAVAWRLPSTIIRWGNEIRRFADAQTTWYRTTLAKIDTADEATSCALFGEGMARLDRALVVQTTGILGMIQPLHGAVEMLVEKAGPHADLSILCGPPGGAEMAVVADIWAASRGRLDVAEVARRHGFHGPAEGELASRVWREDDAPLRALVEAYRQRGDDHDPSLLEASRRRLHGDAERFLLQSTPALQRPAVRLLLHFARTRLPLRGAAKRSFLQAFDVCRAAARRAGEHLVERGALASVDDACYLTATELRNAYREDADFTELVRQRRSDRLRHQAVALPEAWRGTPTTEAPEPTPDAGARSVLQGVGVSAGVVQGRVRVLLDPDFAAVEPDEILVAPTTDPSWSSVMFVSAALIVDIGGVLSHAAVVARELGLPCVVNTRTGTTTLRTGDIVRVDGAAGTVTVIDTEGRDA
jgi:phosphohistidine swiveling domain-containing protein